MKTEIRFIGDTLWIEQEELVTAFEDDRWEINTIFLNKEEVQKLIDIMDQNNLISKEL